ncbi:MAG: FAD-dependent monooxygenase [Mucilaginibacter sp.]|nr:FAD-dependent monooxygenase [Mucilaginibacter sp.]
MKADHKKVLVSGASFAGLSTAYWMNRFGYDVTIIEVSAAIKKGGTPVNILGQTIDIVKRMGLFDQIKANNITMQVMEFKNDDDVTESRYLTQENRQEVDQEEYEIERDGLLQMLYDAVKDDVTFIFSDSITAMQETENGIQVGFKNGSHQEFDLVFGCDGIHSAVRRLWFGPEAEYLLFLQAYFSITIVNKLLIPENTNHMYSEPGKTMMLNAYNGKTDICFAFSAEQEIPYDYRDELQMRAIISDQFKQAGWRAKELLEEVANSKTFYFDKLCQTRMPSWTKGRVALVGDAGYCPSPAAGRGGSIAIDGASALAGAFEKCGGDFKKAFHEYDNSFRPFIEEIQAGVVKHGVDVLVPKTEEAIRKRNKEGFGF